MNLYANQQQAIKGDTTTFVPITKAELMVFIKTNIAMEVVSLSVWSIIGQPIQS